MPWIEANGAESARTSLSGAGKETLVLMHEAGGCLESYEDALPGLEKDFRVLRYDQRGFGFSEKVREMSFETVVADLAGAARCAGHHRAGVRRRLRDGQRFLGRIRRASPEARCEARHREPHDRQQRRAQRAEHRARGAGRARRDTRGHEIEPRPFLPGAAARARSANASSATRRAGCATRRPRSRPRRA